MSIFRDLTYLGHIGAAIDKIQAYINVDVDIVWKTILDYIPTLEMKIKHIIDNLDGA